MFSKKLSPTLVEFPVKGNCVQFFYPQKYKGLTQCRIYQPEYSRKHFTVYAGINDTPNWTDVDQDGKPFTSLKHCKDYLRWLEEYMWRLCNSKLIRYITLDKNCREVSEIYK
jgi:hypothetical protein